MVGGCSVHEEIEKCVNISVGKSGRKWPLQRRTRRLEDNIKNVFYENSDAAKYRICWQTVVNWTFWFHKKTGNVSTPLGYVVVNKIDSTDSITRCIPVFNKVRQFGLINSVFLLYSCLFKLGINSYRHLF